MKSGEFSVRSALRNMPGKASLRSLGWILSCGVLFGALWPINVLQAEPPHPTDAPPLINTRLRPSVTDILKTEAEAIKRAEADRKTRAESLKHEADTVKATKEKRKAAKKRIAGMKTHPADAKANPLKKRDDAEAVRLAALSAQKPLIDPGLFEALDPDTPTLHPPAAETSGQTTPVGHASSSDGPKSRLEPDSGKKRVPLEASVPKTSAGLSSADVSQDGKPAVSAPSSSRTDKPAKQASEAENGAGTNASPGRWKALGRLFNPLYDESGVKPVSYSPLPGIAIFPVLRHGGDKAFGDLPMLFASEYAGRLALKAPDTRIYPPIYTVEAIRLHGLWHIYDQIMNYYRKAGQPEPAATGYLLKQIEAEGKTISRLIFVEADVDTNRPDEASGLLERVAALMTDGTPKSMKALVHSRIQVFDAENPTLPMVWANSWQRTVSMNRVRNVTPSVYDDSDSARTFAAVSRQMSRELIYVMPKTAYMSPVYDASVHGKLAGQSDPTDMGASGTSSKETTAFPNLSESPRPPLSEENQRIIQRILQRQNAINP